jgi:hypothetical protein
MPAVGGGGLKANEKQVEIPSGLCSATRCPLKAKLVIGTTFSFVFRVFLCCKFVEGREGGGGMKSSTKCPRDFDIHDYVNHSTVFAK